MKYINEGLIVPYIAAPVFTSGSGGILTISGSVNISGSLNGTDVLDTQILFKSGSTLTGNSNFIYNYPTNSFQHGDASQALGVASHAEGQGSIANNLGSHAEGYYTVTGEAFAHAEGSLSQALGFGSHAEGGGALANNTFAHAEGEYTRASGYASHAEGSSSIALGVASHAEGLHTIASGAFQTTVGKYNKQGNTTDLFIVGGGSADNNRKDVFNVSTTAITMSGSINISGSLTVPSGITANLTGTSSWATNAVTASLAPNYVLNSSTSSFQTIAPQDYKRSTYWYALQQQAGSLAFGTVAFSGGTITYVPFIVTKTVIYTDLAINVTATSSGTQARVGIYNSDASTHVPTTNIVDSGLLAINSTGTKSVTLVTPITLTPGLYYTATFANGAATLVSINAGSIISITHGLSAVASSLSACFNQSLAFAALPASATPVAASTGTQTIAVFGKVQ